MHAHTAGSPGRESAGPAGRGVIRRIATVTPFVLGILSCGRAAPESGRSYHLADTLVVENLRPIIADTLHPRAVARYGMADGPVDYLFSDIRTFAVDGAGSVYVYDGQAGIRRFDPAGAFRGLLAGAGEGPGEVGSLTAMEAAPDGRVAVLDGGNWRVSVFDTTGGVRSVRMPEGLPRFLDGAIVFGDDGSLWIGVNALYPDSGELGHPRPIYLRLDADGRFSDTIRTPASIAHHCPTRSTLQHLRGFWHDTREPFVPMVKWALGADGTVALGCNASYRFYVHRPDGSVMRVARARASVRVSAEERAFRAAMPVPEAGETLPAYVKLRLPDDGRIWVWPTQPNVRDRLPPETAQAFGVSHTWGLPWQGAFDVFQADGRWLAVVALPPRARYSGFPTEPGVVIRGDTLWAVEQDSLDVRTIVRYQVPGLTPSAGNGS